jgi:hypothetical protein
VAVHEQPSPGTQVARLTLEELAVLTRLGEAYRAYEALPDSHPVDHDEVAFHVHAIGRIVLARAAAHRAARPPAVRRA